jgi:hypothetical protein
MKFISSLQGTAAVQVSADDVVPTQGLVIADLIGFLGNTYKFAVRPQLPPGISPSIIRNFVFQAGELLKGNDKFAIANLVIWPNGESITAASTDIADLIMNDYMERLDNVFKFRYNSAKIQRLYLSNIVIEFEATIADKIESLGKIKAILNREIHRPEIPFDVKRLTFGYGDVDVQPALSLDAISKADFVLERRAGEPYSRNRYFSAAPVSTAEHVRILELIEQALE